MLNENQSSIKITVPYGMVLYATGIPQEYLLVFSYTQIAELVKFAQSLNDEVNTLKSNVDEYLLKTSEPSGCQHLKKERHKFTTQGVFCLDCNKPILLPINQPTPSVQPIAANRKVAAPEPPSSELVQVEVAGQKISVPAALLAKMQGPEKPDDTPPQSPSVTSEEKKEEGK